MSVDSSSDLDALVNEILSSMGRARLIDVLKDCIYHDAYLVKYCVIYAFDCKKNIYILVH